jgi:hypothetical protein
MRKPHAFWHISPATAGLLLLLTGCGGIGGSTTTNTITPTPSIPPIPAQSTLSFTASGGLSGTYTFKDSGRGSSYTSQELVVLVGDQNWFFTMSYNPYKGPGTFTFSSVPTSPPWGSVAFSSTDGTKAWQLVPPATCQLTVTSDVALKNARGVAQYHEVKATFSCSSLSSLTADALAISSGQFDIVAQVLSQQA